jgi:hypothetical protein
VCQKFAAIPRRESKSLYAEGHMALNVFKGRRGVGAEEMGVVLKERAVITS